MANVDSLLFQYLNEIPASPERVAIEHLYEIVRQIRERTGGDTDSVADTESQIIETRTRASGVRKDDMQALSDQLAQVKRYSKTLEQTIHLLSEQLATSSKRTRSIEQKLNELIERYDSGT